MFYFLQPKPSDEHPCTIEEEFIEGSTPSETVSVDKKSQQAQKDEDKFTGKKQRPTRKGQSKKEESQKEKKKKEKKHSKEKEEEEEEDAPDNLVEVVREFLQEQ